MVLQNVRGAWATNDGVSIDLDPTNGCLFVAIGTEITEI